VPRITAQDANIAKVGDPAKLAIAGVSAKLKGAGGQGHRGNLPDSPVFEQLTC
jgi:hypothetical protein